MKNTTVQNVSRFIKVTAILTTTLIFCNVINVRSEDFISRASYSSIPFDPISIDSSDGHKFIYHGENIFLAGIYPQIAALINGDTEDEYDYIMFLNTLSFYGFNLFRSVFAMGSDRRSSWPLGQYTLTPWQRTGPGYTNDGGLKYDLNVYNEENFQQWDDILKEAEMRGIVVQMIILDCWCIKRKTNDGWGWDYHPFNGDNNVNGIDATGSNGVGSYGFTNWNDNEVVEVQKALIRKIVDHYSPKYGNLIYEIANENYYHQAWELNLADYLTSYEQSQEFPQHIVMPRDLPNHDFDIGSNPYGARIKTYDPYEINDGMETLWSINQPLISDSDGLGHTISAKDFTRWYWACFTSGGFTDFLTFELTQHPDGSSIPEHLDRVRYLTNFVDKTNYSYLQPADQLIIGDGFCIGVQGSEYVVYLPIGGTIDLDLSAASGTMEAEWLNPRTGAYPIQTTVAGGAIRRFMSPDSNDWVLHIWGGSAMQDTIPPQITDGDVDPCFAPPGNTVTISVLVKDASTITDVTAYIESPDETVIAIVPLVDNGTDGDEVAGDNRFSGPWIINMEADFVVDFSATDTSSNIGSADNLAAFTSRAPPTPTSNILLVADSRQGQYLNYYTDALAANGYQYDTWSVGYYGEVDSALLSHYANGVVIWYCGHTFPTLSENERYALGIYLDAGGNLFITEQDIGWDLTVNNPEAAQWYQDKLHAIFVKDDAGLRQLQGVTGDPISDSLTLTIEGGDGANNQLYPSEINPIPPAVPILFYSESGSQMEKNRSPTAKAGLSSYGTGALRVDTGTYKLVYFAFGFEGINNFNDRITVLDRVMNWLKQDFDVWDIKGEIKYYSNDEPVGDTVVFANSIYKDTTDAAGCYGLLALPPDNYVVCPEKENDLANSISPFDAAWVLQYGVGLRTFAPYQLIAADVSGDGTVSAFDAAKILQYSVGLFNQFPVMEDSTHFWRFVPEDFAITPSNWTTAPDSIAYTPLNSDTTDNYFGIIYGDVTGNWHPSGSALASLGKSSARTVDIRLENIHGEAGNKVILAVILDNGSDIVAISFNREYDAKVLKALSASTTKITENWQLAYNIKGDLIKVALAGIKPIATSGALMNLEFEVLGKELSETSSSLNISEITINEGNIAVNIQSAKFTTGTPVPKEYALSQNYPNPFNSQTVIKYQLPKPGRVVLKIYNTLGQEVRTLVDEEKKVGYYEVQWDGRNDEGIPVSSGIYIYRIQAGDFVKVRKMLFVM